MSGAADKKMFDLLLDEITDTLEGIEQRCLKLETSDQPKELQIIFRAAHNVKGASQLYGLNEFGAFVHVFEDLLTTLQKANRRVSNTSVDVLLAAQEFLQQWVDKLRDDPKHVADSSTTISLLRSHIMDLNSTAILPTDSVAPAVAQTVTVVAASGAPASPESQSSFIAPEVVEKPATTGSKAKRASGTLRIPSQKIDEVMQLIGELSIHQGILLHNLQHGTFAGESSRTAVLLNQKTLKDLYELALTLRMQSAESLFQRVERISRDIAREQNKKVTVRLNGADTPLDKTVVELITDPMVHLVRNAIDHGIEDVETRKRLGKPIPAALTIKVHQDTGHVIISITDDGRGIDPTIILEKAMQRGLVPAGKRMSEKDIINLIFLPGFSTRDVVTEISGRGVGMDIVQKAIQNLGGRIEIQSKKDIGTTFRITLPASLEIIDGLMVKVSDHLYVVPRQEVAELIDLKSFRVTGDRPEHGRTLQLRDLIVPLEDLSDYIGMNAELKPGETRSILEATQLRPSRGVALVINMPDHNKLALRVDSVMSQQQIVVRPISDNLVNLPGFTGVTILGNGEPTMILSTSAIAESYMKWIHPRGDRSGTHQHGETA